MLASLQYKILCNLWPLEPVKEVPGGAAKLTYYLNPFLSGLKGLDVLDFGCGDGSESLALAPSARSVFGLDINSGSIATATERLAATGYENVTFGTLLPPGRTFDAIISLDAFEHFSNPPAILRQMASVLRPGGKILASFGPTWYHPWGGHLFSVFPWAHLLLSERALVRWRNRFRENKAKHMMEGLNGWTIGKFERMARESGLTVEKFECVPIRALRAIHCRLTRELTTSVVQMTLVQL